MKLDHCRRRNCDSSFALSGRRCSLWQGTWVQSESFRPWSQPWAARPLKNENTPLSCILLGESASSSLFTYHPEERIIYSGVPFARSIHLENEYLMKNSQFMTENSECLIMSEGEALECVSGKSG